MAEEQRPLDEFVVFDTETTGTSVVKDRIVTATIGLMDAQGQMSEVQSWLINPGIAIPHAATEVHGISTDQARQQGMDAQQGLQMIHQTLREYVDRGLPIVAFNAPYDLTILKNDMIRRHLEMDLPNLRVVDPYVIDRVMDQYRKGKRTLTSVAEHYGVPFDGAHDATVDARAAGAVILEMMRKYAILRSFTLEELHVKQIEWSDLQNKNYRSFRRRTDPTFNMSMGWPFLEANPEEQPKDMVLKLIQELGNGEVDSAEQVMARLTVIANLL